MKREVKYIAAPENAGLESRLLIIACKACPLVYVCVSKSLPIKPNDGLFTISFIKLYRTSARFIRVWRPPLCALKAVCCVLQLQVELRERVSVQRRLSIFANKSNCNEKRKKSLFPKALAKHLSERSIETQH